MEYITLAKLIKDMRYKGSLSQQQVADFVGSDKSSVSCWESGKRMPNLKNLKELIDMAMEKAGIDIDYEHVILGDERDLRMAQAADRRQELENEK